MPGNHLSEPPLLLERSISIGGGGDHPADGEDEVEVMIADYRQTAANQQYLHSHNNSHESLIDIGEDGGEGGNMIMSLDRNANQIERINKKDHCSLYHCHSSGTCIRVHPEKLFSSHNHSTSCSSSASTSSDCYCSNPTSCKHSKSFPKERRKTFVAMALLAGGFICNSYSIFLTHQKIPDRNLHPPLPDISLDNITKRRWLNDLADVIVILCTLTSAILVISHRHRWILARRVFFLLSLLYFMRSITMYATVLPLANTHVYCSPKMNSTSFGETFLAATKEVLKLMGAGGLGFMGQKTLCGDYIYSGHTIIFMMTYMLIREYTPKRYATLHWTVWVTAWTGIVGLLISHGHYTIDVIIGYYATTRLFWIYHALASRPENKRRSHSNHFSQVWWFPVFQYLEGNVNGRLPHEYSLPRFWKKSRLTGYAYKTLHMVRHVMCTSDEDLSNNDPATAKAPATATGGVTGGPAPSGGDAIPNGNLILALWMIPSVYYGCIQGGDLLIPAF